MCGRPLCRRRLRARLLLYLLQNNIIFFALSRIDAPTFQVLYQSKIVLTALLSVLMLGRRLSARQWLALLLLTVAVVAVEQESRWEGRRGAGGRLRMGGSRANLQRHDRGASHNGSRQEGVHNVRVHERARA